MIEIIKNIMLWVFALSPYVLMIWMICEAVIYMNRKDKLQEEEEKARRERNRAIYVLALEIRRLNNRIECKACAGEEGEEEL